MHEQSRDTSRAESLFADWAARVEAGEELEFEALVAEHGECADELRALHADWLQFGPILRAVVPGTVVDRDARTALRDEERGARAASFAPSGLLEQLGVPGGEEGRYRFLALLGRGGGGLVLKVFDKRLHRALAMKLVLGRSDGALNDTPLEARALTRFVDEARIASQLAHPGVPPIHELGLDPQGRAFFTMKWVQGDDFARVIARMRSGDRAWNLTRALGVVLRVCETVAYAHDRGVVHRDLKPANVMVGAYGEVYVVDWGLARVLDPSRLDEPEGDSQLAQWVNSVRAAARVQTADSPLVTAHGDVVGTPSFMAPEQARGELAAVGPRADIYSVGAILYEILAGAMPYADASSSTRRRNLIEAVASSAPTPVLALAPRTPPELVAICERAMARPIEQRYASMDALAQDLRAFLDGRVVSSYETGAWAEAKKWVRRNKALAAAVALVATLLVAGGSYVVAANRELGETNRQLVQSNATVRDQLAALQAKTEESEARRLEVEREQSAARNEREKRGESERQLVEREGQLRAAVEFLGGVFRELDPYRLGAWLHVAVQQDAQRRSTENSKGAGVDPRAVDRALEIADWTTIAVRALATALFRPIFERTRTDFVDSPLLAAELQVSLANTLRDIGQLELAQEVAESAAQTRADRLGRAHVDTLVAEQVLGSILVERGDIARADDVLSSVLTALRAMFGEENDMVAATSSSLASLRLLQGRFVEAESLARRSCDIYSRTLGEQHPNALKATSMLSMSLQRQQRFREAEPLSRRVLELRRSTLGPTHRDTLVSLNNHAFLRKEMGAFDEAETLYRESVSGARAMWGVDHPKTLQTINNLASLLQDREHWVEAEALYRESLADLERLVGKDDPQTLTVRANLGLLLKQQGKLDDAEGLYRSVLEARQRLLGPAHRDTLSVAGNLAALHSARHDFAQAEALQREILEVSLEAFGESDDSVLATKFALAGVLLDSGQLDEAQVLYEEALQGRLDLLGPDHAQTLQAHRCLALALERKGDFGRAREHFTIAHRGLRAVYGSSHGIAVNAAMNLAQLLQKQGDFAAAVATLDEALDGLERTKGASAAFATSLRRALRDAHRAWHAIDPRGGHDRDAACIEAELSAK